MPTCSGKPLSSRELGESGRNTPPRKSRKEGMKAKPRENLQPQWVALVTFRIKLMTCTAFVTGAVK